jgi:amidase
VVSDFARARDAAKAADAALARGECAPLLGLPMTVKESFNVAGLPTTWGVPTASNWRPNEDALAVARLKAAGAVILGKTNVPLRLADGQSFNDIYGTTNNPWDLTRTPGGSSGGSAASLAAGYVSLELGSDRAGSLRIPAHYCGVFAHKPSLGLVPLRGHSGPRAPALPVESDGPVAGPMARSAADLALALEIVAGPDDQTDGIAYRVALPPPRHEDLKSFRILVVEAHPLIPTASTVRIALEGLTERLNKAGANVARASPLLPDLAEVARIHARLASSSEASFLPDDRYAQMQAAADALAPDDNSLAAWRTRGAVISLRDWGATKAARARLGKQWRDLFREWDVVLCPPTPTPAIPHDQTPDREARRIDIDGVHYPYRDTLQVLPSVATVAGLPATVAPIGRSDGGLPIGVQIIGAYLEDRTTIRFAELIEREIGFVAPPDFRG